ncbi:MAG TPA: hypothetical protein RMG48_08830 [Myxococcales bacterium LLY-WYZ-16_1]|nr:hypothetical protein [Myxococcales bacterium LLY-WYZ-16_1]
MNHFKRIWVGTAVASLAACGGVEPTAENAEKRRAIPSDRYEGLAVLVEGPSERVKVGEPFEIRAEIVPPAVPFEQETWLEVSLPEGLNLDHFDSEGMLDCAVESPHMVCVLFEGPGRAPWTLTLVTRADATGAIGAGRVELRDEAGSIARAQTPAIDVVGLAWEGGGLVPGIPLEYADRFREYDLRDSWKDLPDRVRTVLGPERGVGQNLANPNLLRGGTQRELR